MVRVRAFEPGDMVVTFTHEIGLVISEETLAWVSSRFKEGKRPGHYFAPGSCSSPDYATQVPVFFEDGTFDVMRSLSIKKRGDLTGEKKAAIEEMLKG